MRDYVTLGSTPPEEQCVQVGAPNYYEIIGEGEVGLLAKYVGAPRYRAECYAYRDLIRKKMGPERGTARLALKTFPHDFGSYTELVCSFDDRDEEGAAYAYACESDGPLTWNDDVPYIWEKTSSGLDFTPKADCDNCGGTGRFCDDEPCHFCLSDAIRRGELDGVADGVVYKGGVSVGFDPGTEPRMLTDKQVKDLFDAVDRAHGL